MSKMESIDQVTEQLVDLISVSTLPARTESQARKLLDRLATPLRVVILGFADPAQPKVINRLLGRNLVSAEKARPPQLISFNAEAGMSVTRANGTQEHFSGDVDLSSINDALFLQRNCDAPWLRRYSVLDLAISGSVSEMLAAVRWAAAKADIAVWCSRTFSEAERRIWDSVPDSLKDHAFLALVDDREGTRSTRLRGALGGEFVNVVPVDVDLGDPTASCVPDPTIGVQMLSSAIARHVDQGKQADTARALLLLRKNQRHLPQQSVAQAAPPVPSVASATASGAGLIADAASRHGEIAAGAIKDPEFQAALRNACAYIKERARELLECYSDGCDGLDNDVDTGFVTECGETIRQVSSILDSVPYSADPEKEALSDVLLEAEEITVLLEIEQDGTPDVDAVCVLLQLRHELEARLAA